MKEQTRLLKKLNPCGNAVVFVEKYKNPQGAWDACNRGDWMLWLLGKLSGSPRSKSRKKLVLTACKCARLSLKYVPKWEKRPLKAIQVAENWARGKGKKLKDIRIAAADAAAAAADVAYAYSADAAADTAYDAAYAAGTAYADNAAAAAAAADAATCVAACVATDAACAANVAVYANADILRKCADIVRKNYPIAPKLRKSS